MGVTKADAGKLLGKHVYALKKDGTVVSGTLARIKKDRIILKPAAGKASTKAIIPLVLFDLLAIGTTPFFYGYPYGYPYGGVFPYNYGYPGFFW